MEYSQPLSGCQPTLAGKVDVLLVAMARLLWPTVCVLCRSAGQAGLDLCSGCERDLPVNECACARCATPLMSAHAGSLCGACLRRPTFVQESYAPYRYAYPIDRLIQGLKYRREGSYGRVLGSLLARALLEREAPLPQALIPVPLSTRRYIERGFNQSYEIARPVSAALGTPIRADVVARTRETPEQAGLARRERRRNVRGAFALRGEPELRHVAIVDDVITTGSTANEVAKVLRRGGVTTVEVWAVARAGGS